MSPELPGKRPNVPRRLILAATAASGVGLMIPTGADAKEDSAPTDHGPVGNSLAQPPAQLALVRRSEIWNQRTYYEPTQRAASFSYNSTFYGQLEAWLKWLYDNSHSGWQLPFEVYSYGAYVDKPGYHGSGRAFDWARVVARRADGRRWLAFHGRTDQWPGGRYGQDQIPEALFRRGGKPALALPERNHLPVQLDPRNHVHIDNEKYGTPSAAKFSTTSELQVQYVQLACYFLWGRGTPVTNRWDTRTRRDSTWVLRHIGRPSGDLTSAANWRAFNVRSFHRGIELGD